MYSVSHNPTLYPHVPAILDGLVRAGVQVGVSSGVGAAQRAQQSTSPCKPGCIIENLTPEPVTVPFSLPAQLAVASRTPTPHVANAFLDKLALRSRFCRWGPTLFKMSVLSWLAHAACSRSSACRTKAGAVVNGPPPPPPQHPTDPRRRRL